MPSIEPAFQARLVRVDADGKAHLAPELFDATRLRGLFSVAGRENDERALNAGLTRARDHSVEIGGEYLVGEVAVGIDQD